MSHHNLHTIAIGVSAIGGGGLLIFLIKGFFIKHISGKVIVHSGKEYLKDTMKDKVEERLFSKKDESDSH
jgi:hypothetical protein